MFAFNRLNVLVLAGLIFALVSWALTYLFPAPPSSVTIATAFKGASFDHFGQRYRERFARANVDLKLRATEGALENLKLLQDPASGVDIAFVTGGVSDSRQSPGILSLGTIDYLPIWIFYTSVEPIDRLSQLKGKRIAVGPVGSGTRFSAEKILGKGGLTSENADFMPLAGNRAAQALHDGEIDVVWILGAPDTSAVQSMLRDSKIRLMSFPTAEAYTRVFPSLARLTLPQGVIDIAQNIPPQDVSLIATTSSVLVRSDAHPEIVHLLLQTMQEIHKAPGVFQRAGEFPSPSDPDYTVAASAIDYYKNGASFLQKHLPLWLTVHAQRAIAVLVTAIAVGLPLFRYLPAIYAWHIRRRLLYWYSQLKSLESSVETDSNDFVQRQAAVDRIEEAVSRIRFPLAFANQVYDLRGHIEIVRRRLTYTATMQGKAAE
ncbi:ABC transporter substrate-binding protein [Bradyrhizobium diazoefficiens]|nr:TAXI family TRAP transporter solute-binding subunit [Bradyrhizobium diazoefficiens]MBR0777152.1 ABC transporter substrate-binding protein [Bradyrhizobium diazoefficiens]